MLRLVLSASLVLASLTVGSLQLASAEDKHEHATKGPHKGTLVELGDEEFHAEIVHNDEMGMVTVYLLGSDAKSAVATDAKDIAVNAKVNGKAVQIKINPAPTKSDKKGTASRFISKSKDLVALLDNHDVKPVLRVTIEGKTFNGKIEHDHDEHDHDHDDKPAPKKK